MSMTIKIKPLVLVGPAGSGRAALSFCLHSTLPHKFDKVISHTTRPPRQNQISGVNFYFTDQKKIQQMREKHQFLTLLKSPHNHYYGLTRNEVENVLQNHKIPIFRLTLSAYVEMVHKKKLDCNAIYIKLKDLKSLQNRLQYSPFSQEQIKEKIKAAKQQEQEYEDYFQQENIIENGADVQESLIHLKSRLFDLY